MVTELRPVHGRRFEAGNVDSIKSGAFSPRMVTAAAAQIRAELEERAPWITDIDVVALDTWCRLKARRDLLDSYIAERMELDGVASVKPYLLAEVGRVEANLMASTRDLGLDPSGRAKLLKDLASTRALGGPSLRELGVRGRKLRELRGRAE